MRKRKFLILSAISIGLVLILFLAMGQEKRKFYSVGQKENKEVADTTDDEGILTNDDPWKETEKLIGAYYHKSGSFYQGTMKLIDDNGSKDKVIEEKTFECNLLGENYYYKIGGIEVVNKGDLILFVDNDNKTLAISGKASEKKKNGFFFDINEFKKLMTERKASARVSQSGDTRMLSIDNIEDPVIQGYRIYYDPGTYKIEKILIGMLRLSPLDEREDIAENQSITDTARNEDPDDGDTDGIEINTYTYYLEIIYTEIKELNTTLELFHPENKFIKIVDKKIEVTPPFRDYQLVNNIE